MYLVKLACRREFPSFPSAKVRLFFDIRKFLIKKTDLFSNPYVSPHVLSFLYSFTPSLLNSFTPKNEKNVFLVFLMIDLYHRVMKIEMVKRSANLFVRTIYQLKIQSTWYFKSIIRPVFNVFFNLVFFPVFFSCFLPCFPFILGVKIAVFCRKFAHTPPSACVYQYFFVPLRPN